VSEPITVPSMEGGGFSGVPAVASAAPLAANNNLNSTESIRGSAPGVSFALGTLAIIKQNDSIVVLWKNSGAVLESADSIRGPFTTVEGSANTNAVTIPTSSQQKFYRLRLP
jgi:hypothetical protein